MNTFKAICLPLAVVCVCAALMLPVPRAAVARWVLLALGAALALIALFVSADAVA